MYCEILLYTICKAIARWQASKLKRYLFIKKQNSAKTAELFIYLFLYMIASRSGPLETMVIG